MSSKRNPLAKLTVMVKRKKGMNFEDFDKHWSQVHGPLFSSLPIVKEKIVKYIQIHHDMPRMEAEGANGFPMYDSFDGVMNAYAEKWEDFTAIFESEDYKKIIMPDEDTFIQREECKMFFSYDEIHWDRDDPTFSSSSS